MRYINRGSFICDNCRLECGGTCHEKLKAILDGTFREGSKEFEENKDLIGRKQIIHCLGPYCQKPCKHQRKEYTPFNEEDGLKPLFALIDYLGNRLNDELTKRQT